ncbi:MAG: alpha/beta family hydrolase [Actinomycetes bacterium]|jgi:predicted alpha/beta-hydrolase family hydrolase
MSAGLLLFPGAGSSSDHSSLVAIEHAVTPRRCVRADFPYRRAGRRAPDRAPLLIQAVVDEAATLGPGPLVLGGRSMGGRMCSMAVADGLVPNAVGLVLVSYPLHPPGRPDRLRVEHLPRIEVPCLFVHGTRDTFGTPDELERWTATIPGAPASVTHVWIDRAGHDLKGADDRVAAAVAEWLEGR